MESTDTDKLCISAIRALSADMPTQANSGHPGAPLGLAPIAHILFGKGNLNISPANPDWINRDRFILSNGHACALLYSMLHLVGFEDMTMEQLKNFRQIGSKTPGHPERLEAKGIEITTGPLGQGISSAVGFAIAARHLGATCNKEGFDLINNYTYVFAGDGCLQEGVSAEASSLAGHLGLGKLIVFYDDNKITIDGETSLAFTEDVPKRYEAYGWQTLTVEDGNDFGALTAALKKAQEEENKPTLISVKTIIGFGSKNQGTKTVHGSPLDVEDLKNLKTKFGLDPEKTFFVPDEVRGVYKQVKENGGKKFAEWSSLFESYAEKYPTEAADLKRRLAGELPDDWESLLPSATPDDKGDATRKISGKILNALAGKMSELFGGSADLNPSCFTYLNDSTDFQKATPAGRNIRFGVREHAMAAILNGIAAYGAFIPYGSTFLNFIGYAFGAVTLSALNSLQVLYIFTHDSIGLGEDGPTHQPVEKYFMVRSTPNCLLLRPADVNETAGAYAVALKNRTRPSVFSLTRQGVPNLPGTSREGVEKGGYVIVDPEGDAPLDLVLVGTGSETHLCVEAGKALGDLRVRVVSFPCFDLFEEQPTEYQQSVFPEGVPVLSVEAGTMLGWEKYAHGSIGMTTFGHSGPGNEVFKHFGFTVENVVAKGKALIAFYKGKNVPYLLQKPWL